MLKIIALCANGMGTSSLIERKVQGIMDALGVEATVTHASLGTGKTKAKGYQIVLCSNAFVGDIEAADLGDTKVIGVKNLMSDKEIELLDNYHKMVYEMISPYLTLEEKIWLRDTVKGGNSSK